MSDRMKDAHAAWIESYVSRQPNRFVRGKCEGAARAMVAAFPDLRLACGFAECTWGRDAHWWCVAPSGEIVDPTAAQFVVVFRYDEIDPSTPEGRAKVPTGRCMNCGESVFRQTFCDDDCRRATSNYMNRRST